MFTEIGTIGIDTGVWACHDCGALVAGDFKSTHIQFHADLRRLEADHGNA